VRTLQGFRALVLFENGEQREKDFELFLQGPVFEPMRNDPAMFRSMSINHGVITWPNGADIDPDVLYYGLQPARLKMRIIR
jgi:hypothetical protein